MPAAHLNPSRDAAREAQAPEPLAGRISQNIESIVAFHEREQLKSATGVGASRWSANWCRARST